MKPALVDRKQKSVAQTVRRAISAAMDLIYPARANCLGCGSPLGADEGHLCLDCWDLLVPAQNLSMVRCPHCGRPSKSGGRCKGCKRWPSDAIDLARFAYPYRRPVDRMIRRMKYGGVHTLAQFLGTEIANMLISQAFPEADAVCAVPMHARRLRARGFNHAALLARVVADQMRIPCLDALTRTRHTRQQARLDRASREKNMRDAFVADGSVLGKRVLLIDDVLTSGATTVNCALALKKAGADKVYVATLAAALE